MFLMLGLCFFCFCLFFIWKNNQYTKNNGNHKMNVYSETWDVRTYVRACVCVRVKMKAVSESRAAAYHGLCGHVTRSRLITAPSMITGAQWRINYNTLQMIVTVIQHFKILYLMMEVPHNVLCDQCFECFCYFHDNPNKSNLNPYWFTQ